MKNGSTVHMNHILCASMKAAGHIEHKPSLIQDLTFLRNKKKEENNKLFARTLPFRLTVELHCQRGLQLSSSSKEHQMALGLVQISSASKHDTSFLFGILSNFFFLFGISLISHF